MASASPQRRAILTQLRIDFTVRVPQVTETTDGPPRDLVVENARRKALAVEGRHVLAADTTVALDGRCHGKPDDRAQAAAGLRMLAGRAHEVWGGIALREGDRLVTGCARTLVRFRALSEAEIDWYVDSGEWRDRAGGYAIQGLGAALVEAIEGDFFNVVGLPVAELLRLAPDLLTASAPGSAQDASRGLGDRLGVR